MRQCNHWNEAHTSTVKSKSTPKGLNTGTSTCWSNPHPSQCLMAGCLERLPAIKLGEITNSMAFIKFRGPPNVWLADFFFFLPKGSSLSPTIKQALSWTFTVFSQWKLQLTTTRRTTQSKELWFLPLFQDPSQRSTCSSGFLDQCLAQPLFGRTHK